MMDEKTDFEKFLNGLLAFADIVSRYYKALIENGLDEDTALHLTIEYQKHILNLKPKDSSDASV